MECQRSVSFSVSLQSNNEISLTFMEWAVHSDIQRSICRLLYYVCYIYIWGRFCGHDGERFISTGSSLLLVFQSGAGGPSWDYSGFELHVADRWRGKCVHLHISNCRKASSYGFKLGAPSWLVFPGWLFAGGPPSLLILPAVPSAP